MEAKKEFTSLENGWKREVVYRKSGATAGRADVYYHSPCGKRFRSRLQVKEFMGDAFNPADFDFHTPHAAGYVAPTRATRPHRTGGGGGGHGRPRQNDSRLARAVKNLQQQRPLGQQLLERNYCGLVRQPVTCLLPQSHDMALAKLTPPMASVGTQKSTLTLRDSQWLHEHRLHGLVPVDGRTGEPVPPAELAFHNRPPPQLQSLVNGPSRTSSSTTSSTSSPPSHNGVRTSSSSCSTSSTSGGSTSSASGGSTSWTSGGSTSSTSGGSTSSSGGMPVGRQLAAAPALSPSPVRGATPAGASRPLSGAGARGQPMPPHSLTPLVRKPQSPQRPLQQQQQQQQHTRAPGSHMAGVAWRNGSTQHQHQLAVATGVPARAAAVATALPTSVMDGSVWPGMRLATSGRQTMQIATAGQGRAPGGSLPGGASSADSNMNSQGVSDMDIHIQEERVRQLKEKLLLAAGK